MNKIRVMIVDDSALVRQLLTEILSRHSDIEVIATASDPLFAQKKIQQEVPDVLLLDIEMPRMDGLTFLRQLMQVQPLPVVICSSLTVRGAKVTVDALAAGAVAVVTKPQQNLKHELASVEQQLLQAVRTAAQSSPALFSVPPKTVAKADAANNRHWDMVLIGTSTGGTQAIELILAGLTAACPGIVIVQHMPAAFTGAFAERLHNLYQVQVVEAKTGERVTSGKVIIAPGGRQLTIQQDQQGFYTEVTLAPPVNRHCPSVDVMFRSASVFRSAKIAAFLLTGMGSDGAKGLLALRQANSVTFVQNEKSSIVYGMPKEGLKLGAAEYEVDLSAVANVIVGDATAAVKL